MNPAGSSDLSHPQPFKRRTKSWAQKCERCCCAVATGFPLAFVYGLSTWAVWVEASLGFMPAKNAWSGLTTSIIGIALYILLNTSYTVAVFTDPGSPIGKPASKDGYSHLPTTEPRSRIDPTVTAITVNSVGAPRFCKKCVSPKPDRAHHCSTCRRCVLKMDHHCPWLATCVGLYNYKAFLLFLIYNSIFCWVCFAVSGQWLWAEVLADEQYLEILMPINVVMLAVIAGIIGLVLTGFTVWHISLACRGVTTIECLERTRYLSPLRQAHQEQLTRQQGANGEPEHDDVPGMISDTFHKAGEHLLAMHANAIPGATRIEEGEEHPSPTPVRQQPFDFSGQDNDSPYDNRASYMTPAQASLTRHHHRSASSREASSERRRYQEYLDEEFAPKLPHAFNLGWRRNLLHLFGPNPWLWWLPICNTTGDGWRWEISPKWVEAREKIAEERRTEEERVGIRGVNGAPTEYERDRDYDYHDYHVQQLHQYPSTENNPQYHHTYNTYDNNDHDHPHHQQQPTVHTPSEVGSGLSMRTLNLKKNKTKNKDNKKPGSSSRSSRRDFDRGEDGDVESFQVSGSSSSASGSGGEEADDDSDGEDASGDERGGWRRW